jgi:hypothetical protein
MRRCLRGQTIQGQARLIGATLGCSLDDRNEQDPARYWKPLPNNKKKGAAATFPAAAYRYKENMKKLFLISMMGLAAASVKAQDAYVNVYPQVDVYPQIQQPNITIQAPNNWGEQMYYSTLADQQTLQMARQQDAELAAEFHQVWLYRSNPFSRALISYAVPGVRAAIKHGNWNAAGNFFYSFIDQEIVYEKHYHKASPAWVAAWIAAHGNPKIATGGLQLLAKQTGIKF